MRALALLPSLSRGVADGAQRQRSGVGASAASLTFADKKKKPSPGPSLQAGRGEVE
jgi:hypothetical protein